MIAAFPQLSTFIGRYSMHLTLGVLAVTVLFFMFGRLRADLVALCSAITLTLFGILSPQEALTGFSNPIIFTTAGMFLISGAIVRTGLASIISNRILGFAGKNTSLLFTLVMLLAALIGSLVSNTGTVAIMMPIVVSMAIAIEESPSRFLMPLAFMSSIGGMFTLIGNSPNMVVNDVYVKAGFPAMSLFSFFPVGLVCFIFGMTVLSPAMSWFLSRRRNDKTGFGARRPSLRDLAERYQLAHHLYRVTVPAASPMVGRSLTELRLPEKHGLTVQQIIRKSVPHSYFGLGGGEASYLTPGPETVIQAGDSIQMLGSDEDVNGLALAFGIPEREVEAMKDMERGVSFTDMGMCELVLMSSSRLVERTVTESRLRDQFGITVLSIRRGDRYIFENMKDRTMRAGDALLVQGTWENIAKLEDYAMNWVVVGRPREMAEKGKLHAKIPLVVMVLAFMLGAMALNLLPTVVAVLIAAVALVVGGCFKNMDDAYSTINWETVVMIASLLPMALAMDKTGVVDIVADHLIGVGTRYGPYAALAVVYGVCSFMNILISTTPVSLLIAPVAMRLALDLGYNPLPFLYAVATASSMCFASPFSTPSNALVMSAGRYTFFDYVKIGLPLQLVMGVVMVVVLPLLFPFAGK